jgi:hypothetical protein
VFNAGRLYLDFNDDGNFNPGDGDVSIQDYFVQVGDGSTTKFGTLPPHSSPYRVFFFGNVFDATTDSFTTLESYADFESIFTVIPEPATGALLAFSGLLLVRTRRR